MKNAQGPHCETDTGAQPRNSASIPSGWGLCFRDSAAEEPRAMEEKNPSHVLGKD